MKETTELFVALFQTVNSIVLAAKDGKLDANDIALLIPLIISWQQAVKDLRFAQEAAAATPAQIEAAFNTASNQLGALAPDVKAAVVGISKGAYYGYWLAAKKGFEAGLAAAKSA